jgi:hypothetical protein
MFYAGFWGLRADKWTEHAVFGREQWAGLFLRVLSLVVVVQLIQAGVLITLLSFHYQMFQKFSSCPFISRLFGRKRSFLDQSKWPEDIDDIIESSDFGSDWGFVHFLHHLLGSLLKRNGGFPADEKLEESTGQVLKRLFLLEILNLVILSFLHTLVDGPDSLRQTSPFVIIFSFFANNVQTFQNVDHIVDSSSFNTQSVCDFVQLNHIVSLALKMLDKFFGEFFQWFGLAIVAEDPVVDESRFFLIESGIEVFRVSGRLVFKDKDGKPLGNEVVEMK